MLLESRQMHGISGDRRRQKHRDPTGVVAVLNGSHPIPFSRTVGAADVLRIP
jgi:hypothetical protein